MPSEPVSHLPDPEFQYEFYVNVSSKRAFAWVIDFGISIALTVPALLMTFFIGFFFLPLLLFVVTFLYRWWTIANGSATWGMRLMAIELRNAWGQDLDSSQAFMHTLIYTICFTIFPLQLVSIVLMAIGQKGQGIPDNLLGTVMLNRRA